MNACLIIDFRSQFECKKKRFARNEPLVPSFSFFALTKQSSFASKESTDSTRKKRFARTDAEVLSAHFLTSSLLIARKAVFWSLSTEGMARKFVYRSPFFVADDTFTNGDYSGLRDLAHRVTCISHCSKRVSTHVALSFKNAWEVFFSGQIAERFRVQWVILEFSTPDSGNPGV